MKNWIRRWLLLSSNWVDIYQRGFNTGFSGGYEIASKQVGELTQQLYEQKITHNRVVNQHRDRVQKAEAARDDANVARRQAERALEAVRAQVEGTPGHTLVERAIAQAVGEAAGGEDK